jgi:hypothetical protein
VRVTGRKVLPTIRTDIFALGSAIYEIFTGYPPYTDKTTAEVKVLFSEEKWPTVAGMMTGDIILRCWGGDYKSVQAVKADLLERYSTDEDEGARNLGQLYRLD